MESEGVTYATFACPCILLKIYWIWINEEEKKSATFSLAILFALLPTVDNLCKWKHKQLPEEILP